MGGLLRRVLGERITVRSELPLDEAARWLGSAVIIGRSPAGIEIRRETAVLNPRGGWQPVLRGRLTADGDGSRFDGVIRPQIWQLVFTGVWTGGVLSAAAGLAVAAVVRPAHGELALVAALVAVGSLMMPALVLAGFSAARNQIEALRSWLTGALHTPWYSSDSPPAGR